MNVRAFRIKICGVTTTDDLEVVARSGADAVGFNFYQKSKRYVNPDTADRLAKACPSVLAKVGVFVNSDAAELRQAAARYGLDWIQLHGDEPPQLIAELAETHSVIRAFRVGDDGLAPVADELNAIEAAGRLPQAILLDAAHGNHYGGTGVALDWELLMSEFAALPEGMVWLLAGGLTPENVAEAVRATHPNAVDTASGVESAPGQKSADKVERFVISANQGWS